MLVVHLLARLVVNKYQGNLVHNFAGIQVLLESHKVLSSTIPQDLRRPVQIPRTNNLVDNLQKLPVHNQHTPRILWV